MRMGLKNLSNAYLNLRKTMPHLPQLLLNDQIAGFVMRDRRNNKFRVELIKRMNEVRSNSNEKLGGLVSFINSYVHSHNLVSGNKKT